MKRKSVSGFENNENKNKPTSNLALILLILPINLFRIASVPFSESSSGMSSNDLRESYIPSMRSATAVSIVPMTARRVVFLYFWYSPGAYFKILNHIVPISVITEGGISSSWAEYSSDTFGSIFILKIDFFLKKRHLVSVETPKTTLSTDFVSDANGGKLKISTLPNCSKYYLILLGEEVYCCLAPAGAHR